jgi:DNA-binding Lrp family transcriptional regulator
MIRMDKLDNNIIKSLNENGRKSLRTISKELKVSLSTVANRIKKLEEEKIIEGYIPLINKEKAGFDLTAVINLKITHGKLMETQKRISKEKHISAMYDITGEWDSLIIAHFKDRKDLNRFIKKILSMDHVERTNTQVALNIVKDEKRLMN